MDKGLPNLIALGIYKYDSKRNTGLDPSITARTCLSDNATSLLKFVLDKMYEYYTE